MSKAGPLICMSNPVTLLSLPSISVPQAEKLLILNLSFSFYNCKRSSVALGLVVPQSVPDSTANPSRVLCLYQHH